VSHPFKAIEEMPRDLVHRPLEWFTAEHYRHRQFCALMHEMGASQEFDGHALAAVLEFLRYELPQHLADEEEDLFPLLRKRALPEDDIDQVLNRLYGEHKGDRAHGYLLRTWLERCLEARTAPGSDPAVALALHAFASRELHHLALENAVVLPLAQRRLTAKDLKALSRRLAARRGFAVERATA
jgi:iron-sulfur cluster repair protein YtfE (RIC family)